LETHALRCQGIHVGRLYHLIAVAADLAGSQLINETDDDVLLLLTHSVIPLAQGVSQMGSAQFDSRSTPATLRGRSRQFAAPVSEDPARPFAGEFVVLQNNLAIDHGITIPDSTL
jgi:hypothetical protein